MSVLQSDILLYVNLVPPCVIIFNNKLWEYFCTVLIVNSKGYSHWIVALFYRLCGFFFFMSSKAYIIKSTERSKSEICRFYAMPMTVSKQKLHL